MPAHRVRRVFEGCSRRRSLLLSAAGLFLGGTSGCGAALNAARLSPAVVSDEPDLRVTVHEVHTSTDIRSHDFSEDTRLVVVVELIARADRSLDLGTARLAIGADPEREPVSAGIGAPPQRLTDEETIPPLHLRAGQRLRAWVAFGNFAPREGKTNPAERVVLRLDDRHVLLLSNPQASPVWHGEPATLGTGDGGLEFQAAGRVLSNVVVLSPFVGVETALLVGKHASEVIRDHWVGPSLGLNVGFAPFHPLRGPFPLEYPPSPLSAYNMHVALVHWFGDHRASPSFGWVTGFSKSIEW